MEDNSPILLESNPIKETYIFQQQLQQMQQLRCSYRFLRSNYSNQLTSSSQQVCNQISQRENTNKNNQKEKNQNQNSFQETNPTSRNLQVRRNLNQQFSNNCPDTINNNSSKPQDQSLIYPSKTLLKNNPNTSKQTHNNSISIENEKQLAQIGQPNKNLIDSMELEEILQSPIQPNAFTTYFQKLLKNESPKFDNKIYSSKILKSYLQVEEQFHPKDFLPRHDINEKHRAKMVDWIMEVLCSYKCQQQTYFLAINLMDRYFWLSRRKLLTDELHSIGVTCIFIACKYEEVLPLQLETVYKKVVYKKISCEQIKEMELTILSDIDFQVTGSTIGEITQSLLFQIFQLNILNFSESDKAFYYQLCFYFAKMSCYYYNFINKYSQRQISAASIYVAIRIIEDKMGVQNKSQDIEQILINELQILSEDIRNPSKDLIEIAKNFEFNSSDFQNLNRFNYEVLLKLSQLQNKEYQIQLCEN